MFKDEKNLKDTSSSPSHLQGEGRGEVSLFQGEGLFYPKTEKLITALYMVTDIIDTTEPLRNKLRTLGVEILSDMHLIRQNSVGHSMSFKNNRVAELLSFLSIASDLNIISEMNCNILKKEFSELDQSIKESLGNIGVINKQINLTEFFASEEFPPLLDEEGAGGGDSKITTSLRLGSEHSSFTRRRGDPKGHTSIGVQKGSTLLKALSKVEGLKTMKQTSMSDRGFDMLKKQRQDSIVHIIKTLNDGATIKDIKDKIKANPKQAETLVFCSEKTLQRELVSMVQIGVLYKTGEKRWSRYFIKN